MREQEQFYSGNGIELHAGLSSQEIRSHALHEAVETWKGFCNTDTGRKIVDDSIFPAIMDTAKIYERFIEEGSIRKSI